MTEPSLYNRAPRALASSPDKLIITDNAENSKKKWLRNPKRSKINENICWPTFIDTRRATYHHRHRADFASLLIIGLRIIWLTEPSDKIEFDVAITAYSFDFEEKVENLIGDALNKEDKESLKIHISQTKN